MLGFDLTLAHRGRTVGSDDGHRSAAILPMKESATFGAVRGASETQRDKLTYS